MWLCVPADLRRRSSYVSSPGGTGWRATSLPSSGQRRETALGKAIAAIAGGLKDVIFGRLTLLALLNFIIAVALTATAAWAIITYAVPLIPNGGGWVRYVSQGGELLASIVVVVLAIALSPAISMI